MDKCLNRPFQRAKNAKQDEYYTLLSDIENELVHYKGLLKDKVIYCNCDNPEWSNFWLYFKSNYIDLGLKGLVSTHYERESHSYKLEFDGEKEIRTDLQGDGDFRSDECVEILKQVDIVVTNPPFSLLREFVGLLMEHKKDFIIIGTIAAVTYKTVAPYIVNRSIVPGFSFNVEMYFTVPDSYESNRVGEDGRKIKRLGNVSWYTTLPIKDNYKPVKLECRYSKKKYPKYDNCDAINVDRVVEIPRDYKGVMGVPVSFLNKCDPTRFELVGFLNNPILNGKGVFKRILVKKVS